jgi:hypothetical protein
MTLATEQKRIFFCRFDFAFTLQDVLVAESITIRSNIAHTEAVSMEIGKVFKNAIRNH